MHAFNRSIRTIREWLQLSKAARAWSSKALYLEWAAVETRNALGLANKMRDRKRAALCLRILNWIRADIARTV